MFNKILVLDLVIAASVLILSESVFGREVVAKADGVQVYEQTDKAKVLQTLKKGDAVDAVERKGMFWQVTDKDIKGYVMVTQVQSRGSEDKSAISSALREAVQQGRKEDDSASVRSRSAVMGVRGLDSSDAEFAGNVKPNLRMVYAMENLNANKAQVKALGNDVQKELESLYNKK